MKPQTIKTKLKVYSYIVVVLLAILGARLAIVQFFHQQVYQTQAKENRIRLVAVKAPRGEIYDRNGEILAANELVYTLSLSYLGLSGQDAVVNNLVGLMQSYYPEIDKNFIEEKIKLQQYRLFEPVIIVRDIPWELVVKLEENRKILPGVTVTVEPLRSYPEADLAGHVLGYIHSINAEELAGSDANYSINSLIGKAGIEKQYEKELRGRDGARRVEVDAKGRPIRELLTMEPTPGNNLYLTLNLELQKVLEKSMDQVLEQLQGKYPKAKVGSAVVLNVKTGEILAMSSRPGLNPDDWKGNLSDEKASYYYPTGKYDPMNPGAEVNRALQENYPPGSTFKPITGMAALEKEAMDPLNDSVNCTGRYWIAPRIKCTGVHGYVNYYSGMAHSCNTYFQEMGRRAGKDEIIDVARQFGLGSKTGIDLPDESKGLLPTPEWKKDLNAAILNNRYESLIKELNTRYQGMEKNVTDEEELKKLQRQKQQEKNKIDAEHDSQYRFETVWQDYDTFNMSIGQGGNNYTVLQLANYIATIANGGYLMRPHVMARVVSDKGQTLKTAKPEVVHEADIKPSTIAETKRAMLAVTEPGGTAYFLFAHFPETIRVAAKTGTAEPGREGDNPKKDFHGVFVAFAPFDDPEIAFAGVIEYGYSGGSSAGLIARDVFEQYFGIKDHLAEERAADEAAAGSENQINSSETGETDPSSRPH
jgi:penicillin-binding protein 2